MNLKERIRFYARKEYYHLGGDVEILVVPVDKVEELLDEAAASYIFCEKYSWRATGGGKCRALEEDLCPKDGWFTEVFGGGDTGPANGTQGRESGTIRCVDRQSTMITPSNSSSASPPSESSPARPVATAEPEGCLDTFSFDHYGCTIKCHFFDACPARGEEDDPRLSVEAARKHHATHGDMDGEVCLLSKCALHYPARPAKTSLEKRGEEP